MRCRLHGHLRHGHLRHGDTLGKCDVDDRDVDDHQFNVCLILLTSNTICRIDIAVKLRVSLVNNYPQNRLLLLSASPPEALFVDDI